MGVVFNLFLGCLTSAFGEKILIIRDCESQPVLAESCIGVLLQAVVYTLEKISDMLHSDLLSAKLFSVY